MVQYWTNQWNAVPKCVPERAHYLENVLYQEPMVMGSCLLLYVVFRVSCARTVLEILTIKATLFLKFGPLISSKMEFPSFPTKFRKIVNFLTCKNFSNVRIVSNAFSDRWNPRWQLLRSKLVAKISSGESHLSFIHLSNSSAKDQKSDEGFQLLQTNKLCRLGMLTQQC